MRSIVNIAQIASFNGGSPVFVKANNVEIQAGSVTVFGPVEGAIVELEIAASDDCEVMTFATKAEALDYFSADKENDGALVFAGIARKFGIIRGGFVAIKGV